MVPVNPNVAEVQGRRCFARVQDIQPPVAAALLMTSPEATETVVNDCAEAGIRRVWMYRAGGKGAVSAKAVAFCRERGFRWFRESARSCFCRTLPATIVCMGSSARSRAVIHGMRLPSRIRLTGRARQIKGIFPDILREVENK